MKMRNTTRFLSGPLILGMTMAAAATVVDVPAATAGPAVTPTPTEQSSNARQNPQPLLDQKRSEAGDALRDTRPVPQREAQNPLGVEEETQQAEMPSEPQATRQKMDETRPQSQREATNPLGERRK